MRFCRCSIVFLFLLVASCATHPTADIYIEGASVEKSAEIRRLVVKHLKREGFSNVYGIWQRNESADARMAVSFSEHDGLISGIRVISHGAQKSEVKSLGENIQAIINEYAPNLDLKYRYFDQTSPFT